MSIVENRKALHDYFIEERYEAGLALEGWEVKAIRAGRAQLKEAYVMVKGGEIFLIGAHISPLADALRRMCTPDPVRTRKLLLHAEEIRRLIGKVERAGYTLIPLDLHYTQGPGQARGRPRARARSSTTSARPREKTRVGAREAAPAALEGVAARAAQRPLAIGFASASQVSTTVSGIERQALDPLLHQPPREVRMVGRPLAADADVLALLGGRPGSPCAAGLDRRDRARRTPPATRPESRSSPSVSWVRSLEPIEKPSKCSRNCVGQDARWTGSRTS